MLGRYFLPEDVEGLDLELDNRLAPATDQVVMTLLAERGLVALPVSGHDGLKNTRVH